MSDILSIMHEISWPIAFLAIGLLAAFGGLTKPLNSISEGIISFFKEFKDFKDQLESVDRKLREITDSSSTLIKTVGDQVQSLQTSLNERLNHIDQQIVATRERVTQESLAVETGAEASAKGNGALLPEIEAETAIKAIVSSWDNVKDEFERKYPSATKFDRREYGSAVIRLAHGKASTKPSEDIATLISGLHSRFKGFTRRRSYAAEWLTAEMRDSFVADAKSVIQSLNES